MTACRLHEILGGEDLSGREVEVLRHTSRGMTARQTGRVMALSPETVREYRKTLRAKLYASNMAHAVAIGFDRGYLSLED